VSDAPHSRSADVAVIGGGIIGLSVAWRLARRHGLAVTLLERARLGAGASSVAAGMLAPVSETEFGAAGHTALQLGLEAARRWPGFAAELTDEVDTPIHLRASGTLMLARDGDEAEALQREQRLRDSLGLATRRLRASEARELEPALAPTLRAAIEIPDDHSVDPRAVLAALARASGGAGVDLRQHTEVRAVASDGTVTLADGDSLSAGHVVVATGAWTSALQGAPAPPVRPLKGQTLRLRDPDGPGLLGRVVRYPGGYLVPRDDGRYVLGATMEERGHDVTATAGAMYELLRDARELVPGVAELIIEELAVGLRPGTPDNLPAIGPASGSERLIWSVGHHRNGILLAPLTADLVAAAVLGEAPGELARACDPARLQQAVPA
jgi:glycine oxidase